MRARRVSNLRSIVELRKEDGCGQNALNEGIALQEFSFCFSEISVCIFQGNRAIG